MKTQLGAVLAFVLLAPGCSGSDIDLGNGVDGFGTGAGTTGTSSGSGGSSGAEPATSGTSAVTGTTTGSSGITGATTGTSAATGTTTGTSAVTSGTSGTTSGGSGTTSATTGNSGTTGSGADGGTTVGSSTTGGSGAGGSSGAGGGAVDGGTRPSATRAIVMRYADIPFSGGSGTGSTSSTGGGPGIDPDTAYLFVGNAPPTCSAPFAQAICGTFLVTIGIPRSLFHSGILSLNDPRLISNMSVRGPDRGGGDCYGGGGSFFDGTLEIVQSGSSLTVRLANTSTVEFSANGSYSVESCPATDGGSSTTGTASTTGGTTSTTTGTPSPTGGTTSTTTGTPSPTGGTTSTTGTPLVLAFHDERVSFTRAAGSFDLFGRSASIETDWVSPETPWLALDRDGNGRIDDGRELFGSMTELPDGTTASNGFVALAALDDDHDGWITDRDEAFGRLVVWRDRNQDRVSSQEELVSAREAGLVAIALDHRDDTRCIEAACEIERGAFVFRDERNVERRGSVIDVHLWAR